MSASSPSETFQELLDASPFQRDMAIRLIELDIPGRRLVLEAPFRPQQARMNNLDQVHGGVIAALVDVAGAAVLAMSYGAAVATIDFHIDFLRPAHSGGLLARAQVRKIGKSVGLADVEIEDDEGRTVALGRCRCAAPGPRMTHTTPSDSPTRAPADDS